MTIQVDRGGIAGKVFALFHKLAKEGKEHADQLLVRHMEPVKAFCHRGESFLLLTGYRSVELEEG